MNAIEDMVVAALRRRFPPPGYALLRGVGDQLGYGPTRRADVLVMGLWPSNGYHLHGVEIKASRADWLRELRTPDKADQIGRFCDRWWLAIPVDRIIDGTDVPATWGILLATPTRTVVLRDAPLLTPLPMPRPFLASILRRYTAA